MIIGLVGKPNSGKSTFFKACTLANVEIANYPFTTIKANEGVGFVRVKCPVDNCKPNHGFCIDGERFVPVKMIDVAGLVPGASEGKGRGNEFLSDLSEADVLIHVLDASGKTDEKGNPTDNYEISKDVEWLEEEIVKWIAGILKKNWKTLERKAKTTNLILEIAKQLSGLKIKEEDVKQIVKKLGLNEKDWTEKQILFFSKEIRKKSKPIIIAANKADYSGAKENIKKLKKKFPDILIVPCSAESELALREAANTKLINYVSGNKDFKEIGKLSEQQKEALEVIKDDMLEHYGRTGVQECLNKAVFDFLDYIVVYPVENENKMSDSKGNVLPDAVLLPNSSNCLDLAYAIHTDIGEKFIAALDAKTKRKLGKESVLKDGDIIKIMTR